MRGRNPIRIPELIDNSVRKESKEKFEINKGVVMGLNKGKEISEVPPEILNDEAKEEYIETLKIAKELGVNLSEVDRTTLINYCDSCVEVKNVMRERDRIIKMLEEKYDDNLDKALGRKRGQLNSAKNAVSKYRSELGLSIGARAKALKSELEIKAKEKDDLKSLF